MTVERLIELLSQEIPQALVVIDFTPCIRGAPNTYEPDDMDGVILAVLPCNRHGRVIIEAAGHDC